MIPISLIFWVILFIQIFLDYQVGNHPMTDGEAIMSAIIFGTILPALLLITQGEVKVTNHEIKIQFSRLYRKRIEIKRIKKLQLLDLKPLQEFGGWGIRWNGVKWGFIFEGKAGIEINTIDHRVYVISSKHANELYRIIQELLKEDSK